MPDQTCFMKRNDQRMFDERIQPHNRRLWLLLKLPNGSDCFCKTHIFFVQMSQRLPSYIIGDVIIAYLCNSIWVNPSCCLIVVMVF